jgi:hypothetical protein
VSTNVYVDRATGNHWILGLSPNCALHSVNAEHSQEPGGFHDPIQVEGGFVARGNVVDYKWSVDAIATPEELRAAMALSLPAELLKIAATPKSAACKTIQTVV